MKDEYISYNKYKRKTSKLSMASRRLKEKTELKAAYLAGRYGVGNKKAALKKGLKAGAKASVRGVAKGARAGYKSVTSEKAKKGYAKASKAALDWFENKPKKGQKKKKDDWGFFK